MSKQPDFASRWLGLQKDESGEYVINAKSLVSAVGGLWGLIETALPAISFSASYGAWKNVTLSVSLAVGMTILIFVSQIIRKRPIMNAISSLIGIGIAAWLALAGGSDGSTARDFYVKDLFSTSFSAILLLSSIALRRPIMGYVLNAFDAAADDWRSHRQILKRMNWLTLFWSALFLVRLSVVIPLYLANEVVAMGYVKTALGLPLYGLWLWLTTVWVQSFKRQP